MSKTIWIVNQYASTPEAGMGGRHYYLAKNLVRMGYKVYLVASAYTHLLREPKVFSEPFMIEKVEGINFVWVNMPIYKDAHDKKRVLGWFIFAWRLLDLPKVIKDKPDAILGSSPSLVVSLATNRLAKKYNARLGFEVRDIWPLTLVELGGYSKKNLFIRLLQWIEDKAYMDADIVFSNLPNAVEHMVMRGMEREKFRWIPNGFDIDEVSQKEPLEESIISKIPKDKFVVGYTGTFGVANALCYFIEAAKMMQEQDVDVVFVLVGRGKEEKALKEMAKGLINVIFIEPIGKKQVQSMLGLFDVCYIGLTKDPLFKFGVSPNKLFDYFYSAKPILYAIDSADYKPVYSTNSGIEIESENPNAIVDGILKLKSMSDEERTELGKNGNKYALKHHDYSKLAVKLADEIFV